VTKTLLTGERDSIKCPTIFTIEPSVQMTR
jgi:hypothetical protein